MSEVTKKLRRMLAQAQGFAKDAPLEALARVQLAAREAEAALATANGDERAELETLRALAHSRADKYAAAFAHWQAEVEARAARFGAHERSVLQEPIPPKIV
jgi:hypothetical protein